MQWIPDYGITIVGSCLQSHILGVAIKLEPFRTGESIGILAEDKNYDFNYQKSRSLVNPQKIMPESERRPDFAIGHVNIGVVILFIGNSP